MLRRLHVPRVFVGQVALAADQARHAREILRLRHGAPVELFDDHGATAAGTLLLEGTKDAAVLVRKLASESPPALRLTVACAVPKGERADWMVEKLSELGVEAFVPLAARRSVVLPEGKNKHERWVRIARESAKQSRRAGVMRIEPLTPVSSICERSARTRTPLLLLSTSPQAVPIFEALGSAPRSGELALLIGPEGGWTAEEELAARAAGAADVRLTGTVLRVETAAVAAAAVVLTILC